MWSWTSLGGLGGNCRRCDRYFPTPRSALIEGNAPRSPPGDELGEKLSLPVPETLYGTYAVAFASPVADPGALAHDQLTRYVDLPLRSLVLGMLDSPMLTLDQRPAASMPRTRLRRGRST